MARTFNHHEIRPGGRRRYRVDLLLLFPGTASFLDHCEHGWQFRATRERPSLPWMPVLALASLSFAALPPLSFLRNSNKSGDGDLGAQAWKGSPGRKPPVRNNHAISRDALLLLGPSAEGGSLEPRLSGRELVPILTGGLGETGCHRPSASSRSRAEAPLLLPILKAINADFPQLAKNIEHRLLAAHFIPAFLDVAPISKI